jgi:DNA polymerase III epsilon subunit-like protein
MHLPFQETLEESGKFTWVGPFVTHKLKCETLQNPEKPFKCCGKVGSGCKTSPTHDFKLPMEAVNHPDYLETSAHIAKNPKRRAVALDCEMSGTFGGSDEAVYLCAADYITGEVLVNCFVNPHTNIIDMRTRIHGISKSILGDAVTEGKALSGWEGARSELWKYIDDRTILVGHSLEHDLNVLRIINSHVVDAGILAKNAVGLRRQWGLQSLGLELLTLEIRKNKGHVHDCLEDVMSTREVVLKSTREKEAFQYWAEAKKREDDLKKKEREAKQGMKKAQVKIRRKPKDSQVKKAPENTSDQTCRHPNDDDCEVLR